MTARAQQDRSARGRNSARSSRTPCPLPLPVGSQTTPRRGAQLFLSEKFCTMRAGRAFPVRSARPDGSSASCRSSIVLDEERGVVLCRRPRGGEAGAVHVVDLAEVRIRNDVDDRAGGRLLPVRRRERRSGELLQLTEVQVLVVEAVAHLMLASRDDVGGLRLKLPVVAAVAGLVEPEAAGDDARADAEVADLPLVDRRRLEDAIERAAERRIDQEVRAQRRRRSGRSGCGRRTRASCSRRSSGSAATRCAAGPLSPVAGSPKNDASKRCRASAAMSPFAA